MRKATVDVGSNSVLLLVEEQTQDGWRLVEELSAVTALGEGTKKTGLLGERGQKDTLAALEYFFNRAKELNAETIQACATMAARIATNSSAFLDKAASQGTPVEIISGTIEAQLGLEAVADDPLFRDEPRLSIIDPGGHSTELTTADLVSGARKVRFQKSFSIGTLAMRAGALNTERVTGPQLLKAVQEMDDEIGMSYLPNQGGKAVVLGATGTNLVSIREKLLKWDPEKVHGAILDYEEVSKAVSWLGAMSDEQRAMVPGMEPGREKTIHLGCLILERFLHALRVLEVSVSVKGWRHALLEHGMPTGN